MNRAGQRPVKLHRKTTRKRSDTLKSKRNGGRNDAEEHKCDGTGRAQGGRTRKHEGRYKKTRRRPRSAEAQQSDGRGHYIEERQAEAGNGKGAGRPQEHDSHATAGATQGDGVKVTNVKPRQAGGKSHPPKTHA